MVGVGTRYPDIGAGGEADGFLRIARLITIIADGDGVPTADGVRTLGKASMEGGGLTEIGAAPTKVGRVPTRALRPCVLLPITAKGADRKPEVIEGTSLGGQ